jgi:hypothetical protein
MLVLFNVFGTLHYLCSCAKSKNGIGFKKYGLGRIFFAFFTHLNPKP